MLTGVYRANPAAVSENQEVEARSDAYGALFTKDAGLGIAVTQTYTYNADFSTARDITAAPTSGKKIMAVDILVSVETSCFVTIQMETTENVLAGIYMPAMGAAQLTLRAGIKGDAIDKKLQMKSSIPSAGACTCSYYSEA